MACNSFGYYTILKWGNPNNRYCNFGKLRESRSSCRRKSLSHCPYKSPCGFGYRRRSNTFAFGFNLSKKRCTTTMNRGSGLTRCTTTSCHTARNTLRRSFPPP